ncbi:serine/threonine-protein kinase-like protein CCR4 [Benincasa hispida]|uniref:serine/threonine-protein kinase-like protein CCR4 n=1 Tax=Benincasa hispida TaxID=102211 RepID=UPI0019016A14|nr:serine/threonine-protein kinase-like protein CCR4 [Benincasa hispida]
MDSFPICSFVLLIFPCFFLSVSSLSTVSISETANQTLVCSLNARFSLNCSSFPSGIQIPFNPNDSYSAIVAGDGFFCGLRNFPTTSQSIVVCWRFSVNGTNMVTKRVYNGPNLKELRAGNSHICGVVNATKQLECWQWRQFDRNFTFDFSSIAVGSDFICGLSNAGEIRCNGSVNSTVAGGGGGRYKAVAAGFRHVCGINLRNELECWNMVAGDIPAGEFKTLALGDNRSCALRLNGTAVCWGEKNFTLPERLTGEFFTAIEAKKNVFCGILRRNFSLLCWGNEIFDQNLFSVFDSVSPGPCRSQCPCGPLPNTQQYCTQPAMICNPCKDRALLPPPPPPPPPSPAAPPQICHHSSCRRWNGRMVALLVVGCVGSLSLVLSCSFFVYKYCKNRVSRVHDSGPMEDPLGTSGGGDGGDRRETVAGRPGNGKRVLEKRLSHLISLGNGGQLGKLEDFPLSTLVEATNNFSEEHKIGSGSFGSVYRAVLNDGREVAIKRAEFSAISSSAWGTKRQEDKDNAFLNELESLSRINHKNLVRLLGFFDDTHERVLVYEFMSNGTLHNHLHNLPSSPLAASWACRIAVALDAARGIQYLHDYLSPPIIHRDIKSSNILLDDKWTAKVSDFGLSLMGPDDGASHLSLRAAGTVGYMDPEYYRLQQLTTKSDVYSFGVVLLELLSGCKAIHKNENGVPRNVVDVMVPYIVRDEIHRVLDRKVPPPTPFEIEAVKYVGYLAADCVITEGRHRPSMTDIVNCLERALAACLAPTTLSRSSTESSM